MKRFFLVLLMAVSLTGCSSFIPKRVEIGQDKVERFPTLRSSEKEIQRQVARRAAEAAQETLQQALQSGATLPSAQDSATLSRSLSSSLGPPKNPASADRSGQLLANDLDHVMAKLAARVDDFRDDNDKNIGHKIEGTGFLQVPYFLWTGGAFVILAIFFMVFKAFISVAGAANPAVGLGVKAVELGGRGAAALASEVIHGGEIFKERIAKELPEMEAKIREIFQASHEKAQSRASQQAVKSLIS